MHAVGQCVLLVGTLPVANTIGISKVHHCPNESCKVKLVRDESGWAIFVFAVTRVLLILKERSVKVEGTYLNRRNDSTQPLAKGLTAQGDAYTEIE